jgi:predicted enzyme related to lactoylglutathione lyase
MPTIKKINVVFLYVTNIQAQREFYENVVGLGTPLLKTPSWVEYRLEEGGTHFALQQTDPAALEGTDPGRNTVKFSMVVEDIQAAYEELHAQGVKFVRMPEKGYGFLIAEFEDPERNIIRLLQYTTLKVRD